MPRGENRGTDTRHLCPVPINTAFLTLCRVVYGEQMVHYPRKAKGENKMNQQKIGSFLKMLRNEKGITQENLAEQFGVSSRTVSRWENGNNMPDISILVEIAEFYDVDIREIIDGERKSENMTEETKEVLVKTAEYTSLEKEKFLKSLKGIVAIGLVAFTFIYMVVISGITKLQGWGKDAVIVLSFVGMIILFNGMIKINQLQENMGKSRANKMQIFGFSIFYMVVFSFLLIFLCCLKKLGVM